MTHTTTPFPTPRRRAEKYGFFWDSYSPAVALLLARETGGQEYRTHWQGFLDAWTSLKGNENVVTSPKGCARGAWASGGEAADQRPPLEGDPPGSRAAPRGSGTSPRASEAQAGLGWVAGGRAGERTCMRMLAAPRAA